jgi:hypothetical protein
MDSSFASLDTDFLMNSDLVDSSLTAPKSRARPHEPTATGPSAGGFCMVPKRGLGRRIQSQRHHIDFLACMVKTPGMTMQKTSDAHVPKDQKRTSAEPKLADHLENLEAQLREKEKECIELRELVDACSQVLPQRIMTGRKAASMMNLGGKSCSGTQRQVSFKLDK